MNMNETPILADSKALNLEKITSSDGLIVLVVKTTQQKALCPRCHQPSVRVHSHYGVKPR